MKKKLPSLTRDAAAEGFVATVDLSADDLSAMRATRCAFQPKSERINMWLPSTLLSAVKQAAAKSGVPYQRFIRRVLEGGAVLCLVRDA